MSTRSSNGEIDVEAEPVHPEVGAGRDQLLEVAESVVSPEWPMITRLRSTPSSLKIVCCSSPRRGPAWVWVEIGTPVRLCAWATARSTRSTPGVMPGSSVAHLRIAALIAGVGDALLDVADEHVGHDLRAAQGAAGALVVEPERDVVVGVQTGGDHDVQVGGRGDPGDARDVAAQPDHGQVDDGVDAAGLQLVEPLDGVGFPWSSSPQASG